MITANETDLAQGQDALDEIRQRYDEDGYYIFRNVIDADLIAQADRHVDWLLAKHPELQPFQLGHTLARSDPFWHRLITDSRLLDIAEIFLGPDLAVFATHYICKEPRTGRPVLWHQDGAFWPIEPMRVITQWLAITSSTPDNGCLKVVPGSHKSNLLDMIDATEDAVLPKEIPVDVDERDAVEFVLEPGDLSVHHPAIFHGSDPNTSATWRRGLTIRYIPTSTRIVDADGASPFLARGLAVPGLNDYLPTPAADPDQRMALGRA